MRTPPGNPGTAASMRVVADPRGEGEVDVVEQAGSEPCGPASTPAPNPERSDTPECRKG